MTTKRVEVPNMIQTYFHCSKCRERMPDDTSMEKYARIGVGSIDGGFQVWCVRCNVNIILLPLEGIEQMHAMLHGFCDVPGCECGGGGKSEFGPS